LLATVSIDSPQSPATAAHPPLARWLIRAASVGAAAWLVLLAVVELPSDGATELAERLLLFAPLTTIPLGLAVGPAARERSAHRLLRAAAALQPIGAGCVAASLCLAKGLLAAALVGPWLLVTGILALDPSEPRWEQASAAPPAP
jgi:hypothetical protein